MTQQMTSENINELAAALSKAQSLVENAEKNKKNPHYKSSYSSLSSVWSACRDALSSNGISVTQTVEVLETGSPVLVTRLMHSSGQWIKGVMPLIVAKNDMQAMGSAISYARRFCLAAMVGVAPDDDDDGNAACASSAVKTAVINSNQVAQLVNMLAEFDDPQLQQDLILKGCEVTKVIDIPASRIEGIFRYLQGELNKAKSS